jgi:hypothetical protein
MSNALPAPDTSSQPDSRRWLMLPVVLLAMFMAGFDIWVVNVAGHHCSATCTSATRPCS